MTDKATEINCNQIPGVEIKNICRTLVGVIERFYNDPENCRKFEAWKATHAVAQVAQNENSLRRQPPC